MTKDFYLLMKSVISEVDPREEEEKGGKILFCESALMGWSVASSHVQDSVTAVVPEEFSSSSSPFPASAGLMFSSFATATPPPRPALFLAVNFPEHKAPITPLGRLFLIKMFQS